MTADLARWPRRAYGSAIVAAALAADRGAAYLPRARLEARRDRRVRRTVAYAARHVPYYRDLFARLRLDPSDIRGAADLPRLPVLDRELLRARPELFVADTRAGRTALAFATSGSTGTPTRIAHDRRSLLANLAWGEREREPVNRACGAFRPRELYVGYETSTFKKVMALYDEALLLPVRPLRRYASLLDPMQAVAARVNAERPDVLVGYGGWVGLFFRAVAARGIALHPPKLVMYIGEALPPGTRELVEGSFGIPVMSRYNAVESFKIGFSCERRTGFHLHEDLCHVWIAGGDGTPAASGAPGSVMLTNLVNRATVLINHPIGDVAALSDAACPCGRTLRLLSELEGRVEDVIALADGRFVHPRAIWQVFKDDPVVLQYQLAQRAPSRFELTLATVDDAAFRDATERARPRLAALLGGDAAIEARRREPLRGDDGGKFRAVVALPASAAAAPARGNPEAALERPPGGVGSASE